MWVAVTAKTWGGLGFVEEELSGAWLAREILRVLLPLNTLASNHSEHRVDVDKINWGAKRWQALETYLDLS